MRKILYAVLVMVFMFFPNKVLAKESPAERAKKEIYSPFWQLNNFVPHETMFKARPKNLTDEQIAEAMAAAFCVKPLGYAEKKSLGDKCGRISKWDGPLRVSLQDSQGKDLDLTKFPGKEIKQYLDDLVDFTHVPLTLTTVAKRDNNVSIVIGEFRDKEVKTKENQKWRAHYSWNFDADKYKQEQALRIDRQDPVVGAIWGVPELDEKSRTLATFLYGRTWPLEPVEQTSSWASHCISDTYEGPPDGPFPWPPECSGVYHVGYAVKACMIVVPATDEHPQLQNVNFIRNHVGMKLSDCLASGNYGGGVQDKYPGLHQRRLYALRLLYNPEIKPGMGFVETKDIILRAIRHDK